jgi:hypothetical protein
VHARGTEQRKEEHDARRHPVEDEEHEQDPEAREHRPAATDMWVRSRDRVARQARRLWK